MAVSPMRTKWLIAFLIGALAAACSGNSNAPPRGAPAGNAAALTDRAAVLANRPQSKPAPRVVPGEYEPRVEIAPRIEAAEERPQLTDRARNRVCSCGGTHIAGAGDQLRACPVQQRLHGSNWHCQHGSYLLEGLLLHVEEHDDLSLLRGELIDEAQNCDPVEQDIG